MWRFQKKPAPFDHIEEKNQKSGVQLREALILFFSTPYYLSAFEFNYPVVWFLIVMKGKFQVCLKKPVQSSDTIFFSKSIPYVGQIQLFLLILTSLQFFFISTSFAVMILILNTLFLLGSLHLLFNFTLCLRLPVPTLDKTMTVPMHWHYHQTKFTLKAIAFPS